MEHLAAVNEDRHGAVIDVVAVGDAPLMMLDLTWTSANFAQSV